MYIAFHSLKMMCDLVAQSVEHRPFKSVVQGSNPCRVTIFFVSLFPVLYDRIFCFDSVRG